MAAGNVSAGVVNAIGARLGSSGPGGEVAIAQRAQGLPATFIGGFEALEPQAPRGHREHRPLVSRKPVTSRWTGV